MDMQNNCATYLWCNPRVNDRTMTDAQLLTGGQDNHSVIADPLFINAGERNYTVDSASPALTLGFQNIDMSTVGRR